MQKQDELRQLLATMDVPARRLALCLDDVRWLGRNIGMRNSAHPQFNRVVQLLHDLAPDALHVWYKPDCDGVK